MGEAREAAARRFALGRSTAYHRAEALHQALGPALATIPPRNAAGCFQHSGHRPKRRFPQPPWVELT
jgi:hypothetical protein